VAVGGPGRPGGVEAIAWTAGAAASVGGGTAITGTATGGLAALTLLHRVARRLCLITLLSSSWLLLLQGKKAGCNVRAVRVRSKGLGPQTHSRSVARCRRGCVSDRRGTDCRMQMRGS
jgi:hypothetical protein